MLLAFHALEKSVRAYYSFKRWLIGLAQQKNRSHRRFSEPQSAMLERSPLLRLPSELRLRVYELALQTGTNANGRSGCVLQLGVGLRGMYLVRCAPYPSSWHAFQHVRSDDDSPSKTLPYILALGGSAKDPFVAPPNRGCVHYGRNESLICGDMSGSLGWQNANHGEAFCRFTSLICVCRTFYCEVLRILYAQNTISFFGADMVPFFIRSVGADGLAMVRNVHLALHLEATRWIDVRKKQKVLKMVQGLKKRFVGLKQLDVEVIFTWVSRQMQIYYGNGSCKRSLLPWVASTSSFLKFLWHCRYRSLQEIELDIMAGNPN